MHLACCNVLIIDEGRENIIAPERYFSAIVKFMMLFTAIRLQKKGLKNQIAIFSSSQNDNWFNICLFIFSTLQAMVEFYATFHTNICRTRFTREKKNILRKMISIDSYWVVKSKHFMRVGEISIVRNSHKNWTYQHRFIKFNHRGASGYFSINSLCSKCQWFFSTDKTFPKRIIRHNFPVNFM